MRLWTLHPCWLDAQGLVALWREALLAQKVLAGKTRGYRQHPQLARFRAHREPGAVIATYLYGVADEAARRGYAFDVSRILAPRRRLTLQATSGQLGFERGHLLAKLAVREPGRVAALERARPLTAHPMFRVVPGPVADWERGSLE